MKIPIKIAGLLFFVVISSLSNSASSGQLIRVGNPKHFVNDVFVWPTKKLGKRYNRSTGKFNSKDSNCVLKPEKWVKLISRGKHV